MSDKRAAMRQEQRQRDKIMKSKAPGAFINKAYLNGRDDGLTLASGIIFLALHEYFGFGNKRLENLMDCIAKESMKMQYEPTKFNVDYYIKQLKEKTGIEME